MVKPIYVERKVTYYAINEEEMHSLSFSEELRTSLFSIGSALCSIAIGIWTNAVFQEKLSPEAIVLSKFFGPILVLLGIVAIIGGLKFSRQRSKLIDKIKRESAENSLHPATA